MATSGASNRPARGLPAEQALEHWSDPDAYAAMREYWAHRPSLFFPSPSPSTSEQEYDRRRRPLEDAFLERLRLGELMASAIPEDADPTASRILVDPEVFSHASLIFEMNMIAGSQGSDLRFVEIFKPPGVPLNVPPRYWEQHEPVHVAAPPSAPDADKPRNEPSFRQEADYHRVWINGARFRLTHTQARVVKLLHQAHLQDDPWQSGKKILGQAGSRSTRMFQVFRSHMTPHWSLLIESDGRGRYRLNIRD